MSRHGTTPYFEGNVYSRVGSSQTFCNPNMNTSELQKKALQTTEPLLDEKGYISFVDVFMKLGYLDVKNYEKWRRGQVPYLEKVINLNLKKISLIVKSVKSNCEQGSLRASKTVYKSWGKGSSRLLKFSKSGESNIEDVYSTHFLRPKEKQKKAEPEHTQVQEQRAKID